MAKLAFPEDGIARLELRACSLPPNALAMVMQLSRAMIMGAASSSPESCPQSTRIPPLLLGLLLGSLRRMPFSSVAKFYVV